METIDPEEHLSEIRKHLQRIVERADKAEADFQAKAKKDGILHALSWQAEDLLGKAQKRALAQSILGSLENPKRTTEQKVSFLIVFAAREAIQRSRLANATRSTSTMDILARLAVSEFWGELAEFLGAIPDLPKEGP